MLPSAYYPTFLVSHLLARLYLQFFERSFEKFFEKRRIFFFDEFSIRGLETR